MQVYQKGLDKCSHESHTNTSEILGMQPLDINLSSSWTEVERWPSNLAESDRKLNKVHLVGLFIIQMLGVMQSFFYLLLQLPKNTQRG